MNNPRWAAVPLRVMMGIILVGSGYRKFSNMTATIADFTKWGFPAPEAIAWFITLLEIIGGAALIVGLCVRYLGAAYTIEFVVAAAKVNLPLQGYWASRLVLMLVATAAALFFLGAGPLSIDSIRRRQRST
jgi:putative oxidoreductase